jgi:hypothetical protein
MDALQDNGEQRAFRLWWSHFRCLHQAEAKKRHQARRARQASLPGNGKAQPILLVGLASVTDAKWEQIRLLFPKYTSPTKRNLADPRTMVEAIVWIINTGSSWRELPERFGSWSSVAERYYRWCREGKWAPILLVLQEPDIPISSSA